jgi:hypothetical protein
LSLNETARRLEISTELGPPAHLLLIDRDRGMDDEDELQEVEIIIEPRFDRLEELGVSVEDFEEAVSRTLDDFHDLVESQGDPDDTPYIDQLRVLINGQLYLLGDIAEIEISGDVD